MEIEFREIRWFGTDDEFYKFRNQLEDLVRQGKLSYLGFNGLDGNYVQRYETLEGEIWLLTVPDKAFRGSFEKQPVHPGS